MVKINRKEYWEMDLTKQGSRPWTMSWSDWKKVIRDGVVAAAGAAILAFASWLEVLPQEIDFGTWEALAVVLTQMAVNALRKFVSDTRERLLE